MGDKLIHRGPDDSGIWINKESGVAFVHRRLSIIDLSAAGHQPMVSHCGRYILVFNGEIYNFTELRQQLQEMGGIPLQGHSDTEVFLTSISQWGIENTLQKSVGMFAFSLWDNKTKTLTLARDRMGEKPLYYGYVGKFLVFASELKALRVHPQFNAEIDREVISLYLRHNYIPAPYSIYKGIYKLYPGCVLTIQDKKEISPFPTTDNMDLSKCSPRPYWSLEQITQKALENPFSGSDEEATEVLEQLLGESIRGQMIADVPLGAFLSGGIDSSTVVALMQANSVQPVRTFSIGFYEENYNEAKQAKAVAKHLGTEHTELYVTSNEAMSVIPQLSTLYDEPFADSSQIPTYLLSQLTRNHVTVSLSGDGGDELFCGYTRYFSGHRLWNMIKWMPVFMRKATSHTLSSLPESILDGAFFWLSPLLKKYGYDSKIGYHLHRIAEVIGVENAMAFYQQAMSHWKNPLTILENDKEHLLQEPMYIYKQNHFHSKKLKKDILRQMMLFDALSYLPDDILVKVDRASMAVGLESRIPLLDHRIVEFAMSLPVKMNYQNGVGKRILRQVLYRYVPKNFVERPKMGFGIPLDNWLRSPLREWVESLLDKSRLQQEGYFHPEPILKKWQEHLSGQRNWQYELWDILMFQAWLEAEKQC
ncbi:asparagine synthase (glutamine-hydrolyzing) [Beggiatoa sp. PS]|nr:asparagine synthase (glutamine-hydrolyzing) [Beggiatoa sp. PS]